MATLKTGGCLCKAIRYELDSDQKLIYNVVCYCPNCKRSSGSQMFCASIFPKAALKITRGQATEYADYDTDSGKPLYRYFCGKCGSSLYGLTPAFDDIVSIFSGGIDDVEKWWVPNKEQYVYAKSHWIPDIVLETLEGVPGRHERGPRGPEAPSTVGYSSSMK